MVTSWLFEFFHELRDPAARLDPAAINAHFDAYVELWVRAEQRGIDGIYFSEHHFGPATAPPPTCWSATSRPAPQPCAGGVGHRRALRDAMAGGGGVRQARSPHPRSHGDGPGQWHPPGVHDCGAVDRGDERALSGGLRCARRARIGSPVTHQGTIWSFDELRLLPSFLTPDPPIWTAVRSVASAARAGARGWKICTGFNSVAGVAAVCDAYREAAAAAGHEVGPDHIGLRRLVTLVDDPGGGAERVRRGKRRWWPPDPPGCECSANMVPDPSGPPAHLASWVRPARGSLLDQRPDTLAEGRFLHHLQHQLVRVPHRGADIPMQIGVDLALGLTQGAG